MSNANVNIPDKQEILRQEEELERKNKWLYPTVICILIVFFIVGFIYGLQSVLSMEGSFPPVELSEAKSEIPQSKEELVAYLDMLSRHALKENPAISTNWRFWIDEDSISTDGSEALNQTLRYLSSAVEDELEEKVDNKSADFSEGIRDIFLALDFSADDIEDFTCDYIFYKCHSCGEESAEPLDHCDYCGSEYAYQMQYRDNYTFTIEINYREEVYNRFFKPGREEMMNAFLPGLESTLNLSEVNSEINRLYAVVSVRRSNDELLSVQYGKDYSVSADADFTDRFASLGSVSFHADFSDKTEYNFTWPALVLNTHKLVLEPKGTGNLLATLVCSDPVAYDAAWISTDEGIVAVDDEGYLKAGKEPGTAIVTASYEFNGKIYEDSCEIFVRIPVESMKLNKRHLTLGVGDEATLTANVSPKKATIRTATFFTTDDSVVTVTEDGTVKGISAGTATVYALSDDGYFKSSCEVTVK